MNIQDLKSKFKKFIRKDYGYVLIILIITRLLILIISIMANTHEIPKVK